MSLRRMIRNFIDPVDARRAAELTRQLADFEDNVAAECDDIRATAAALKPVARAERSSGVTLSPGSAAGFDTTAGDIDVLLAAPEARFAGKLVGVWKRVAANSLTLRVVGGATINGSSSFSRSAVGLQLLFCDGEAYWA